MLREHTPLAQSLPYLCEWIALHPQHMEICSRYLVALRQHPHGLLVPYSARVVDDKGRIYAHGDSAQRLPRAFRLLLYGNTHVEIDMIGAFYELVRRLAQSRFHAGGMLPYITDLRGQLRVTLSRIAAHSHSEVPTLVRKWPLVTSRPQQLSCPVSRVD